MDLDPYTAREKWYSCGFREGLKVGIEHFLFILEIFFIRLLSLNTENTVEANLMSSENRNFKYHKSIKTLTPFK